MKKKSSGFSLIELSIVIVIIGLLIGGVFVGRSLLRNAELRAVTSEFASYTKAIGTFQDKYLALPGDFAAASDIWSGVTNGDGNGLITLNLAGTRLDEQFLAWQHLAKAEMIKGSFTGVAGSKGVRDRVVGVNIPASQLADAGWGLISVTLTDIAGGYTEIRYTAPDIAPNHVLWLGSGSVSGTADSQKPILSPIEAFDIDKKVDDGLPLSGKVVAQYDATVKSPCHFTNGYNVPYGKSCSLVFKTGY